MDQNTDQDRNQDRKQHLLQQPDMEEESDTLVTPQL